jgi:spermidine synthase
VGPGRSVLGLLPGETAALPQLALAVVLAAALPAFLHGAVFVLGAAVSARAEGSVSGLGRAYVWQGAGAFLVGLVLWLAFARPVPSSALVALAGVPVVFAVSAIVRFRRPAVAVLIPVAVLLVLAVLSAPKLELVLAGSQWRGFGVQSVRNSPYGKLVELTREDERLLLYDGVPVLSQPVLDPLRAEELSVVPLSIHGYARKVLLPGGGLELLPALLRFPLDEIVLVALDPELVTGAEAVADDVLRAALASPRVRIVHDDPRGYLRAGTGRFDCIILSGQAALSLAANRLLTVEFFQLCRQRLAVGGVLAIAGPGGTVQAGEESGQLLRLRKKTLEAAFNRVRTVMLDFPLLLASETDLTVGFDSAPARVAAFGRNRNVGNRSSLLDSAYLAGLLDAFRQASLLGRLECDKGTDGHAVNRDDLPLEFALWFAREGRRTSSTAGGLRRFGGVWLWVLLLLSVSAAVFVALKRGVAARRALGVFTSGLAGAAISTLAVVIYQTRFGSLYSEVSLLVAGFMLGAALGGWFGTRVVRRAGRRILPFLAAEAGLIMVLAGMVLLRGTIARVPLILLATGGGFWVGLQFPLAAVDLQAGSYAATAGRVVAFDLAGGVLGALIPVMALISGSSIGHVLLLLILLKAMSLAAQLLPCAPSGDASR